MSIPRSDPLQLVFSKKQDDFTCTAFHRCFFCPENACNLCLHELLEWAFDSSEVCFSNLVRSKPGTNLITQATWYFKIDGKVGKYWQSTHFCGVKGSGSSCSFFCFCLDLESFRIKLTTNDSGVVWLLTLSMISCREIPPVKPVHL